MVWEKKIEIKCECGNIFKTFFSKKRKIYQCEECCAKESSKKNTKNLKDVKKILEDKIKNKYEVLPFEYNGRHKTNVILKCKECGEIFIRSYHRITTNGVKCPNCESRLKKWNIERAEKLVNKYSKDFTVLECNKNDEIVLKHNECNHIFIKKYHNIEQNKCVKCPKCHSKESFGVNLITNYLEKNNIIYIKEYRFEDCKDIRTLPFDFYLPDYNMCIEYDGQQHFNANGLYGEKIDITIKHDKIKNKYCKDNNISLIRIKYSENDNIEKILSNILKIC